MGGRAAGPGLDIDWQDGPIEDGEQTGAQVEDVLEACLDRLRLLNGFVPCGENANALDHMDAAMEALDARTADRVKRKVGGTNAA